MAWEQKYLKYKNKYISLKKQIGGNNTDYGNGNEQVKKHLALYKKLDFDGMNNQNFNLAREIYHPNVSIRMANGAAIVGIDDNLKIMKEMYNMAPDTKIVSHGIQFGSDDWIAVQLIMTGTFTGPM